MDKRTINKEIILEAIQKGIQFALDDFNYDDVIDSKHKDKIIDKEDSIIKLIDLKEQFVNLGLPSGTWWAKANIGADCDNYIESWYGDYFSWGDPESNKDEWGEANYKFTGKMIKYNKIDHLINLQPEDDQATQFIHIHNFNIHIPTKEQCEELIKYCEIIPKHGYKALTFKSLNDLPIDLNGYIVKSKINGNEIFIPSAGYYFLADNNQINEHCAIQSSTIYEGDPYKYYGLMFDKNRAMLNSSYYRTSGLPIRPVCNI